MDFEIIELLENIESLAMEHYDPTAMHDINPQMIWKPGGMVE